MYLKPSSYINKLLFSEKIAGDESKVVLWLIFAIACYIPFEDLISAWLPLADNAIIAFRFIPELLTYCLFIRIFTLRLFTGLKIQKTPIDPLLIAFFCCAIFSNFLNQANLFSSVDHLRSSWRFIAVYYVIANIDVPTAQISTALNLVKSLGICQVILALLQSFLPASTRVALVDGGCARALNKGASCGGFETSATFAAFLLVAMIVVLTDLFRKRQTLVNWQNMSLLLLPYIGLFLSKKRAALVIFSFVPALALFLLNRKKLSRTYIWLGLSLAVILIIIAPVLASSFGLAFQGSTLQTGQDNLASLFLKIFSREYWDDFFLNARGWFIVVITQSLYKSGSWFGFSPDLATAIEKISDVLTEASDVVKLKQDQEVFLDPYWFAQLAFYGVAGLSLYWGILLQLYQTAQNLLRRTNILENQYLCVSFCSVVVVGFLYSFSERIFMVRSFSFYFWMLAGLVVNAHLSRRRLDRADSFYR